MPKKSTPVRSGAQRSKPKASKGFELVRPGTQESESVGQPLQNETGSGVTRSERDANDSKVTATVIKERNEDMADGEDAADVAAVPQRRSRGRTTQNAQSVRGVSEFSSLPAVPGKKGSEVAEEATSSAATSLPTSKTTATIPRGTASERLAARRQGTQKAQPRNAATLVTAEHYSYVRRDLMFIAVLAIVMFIILVVLYFVPGI